jgi:hypothetical protein
MVERGASMVENAVADARYAGRSSPRWVRREEARAGAVVAVVLVACGGTEGVSRRRWRVRDVDDDAADKTFSRANRRSWPATWSSSTR